MRLEARINIFSLCNTGSLIPLIPRSKVFLEMPTNAQKFNTHNLWNPRVHYSVHKNPPLVPTFNFVYMHQDQRLLLLQW